MIDGLTDWLSLYELIFQLFIVTAWVPSLFRSLSLVKD